MIVSRRTLRAFGQDYFDASSVNAFLTTDTTSAIPTGTATATIPTPAPIPLLQTPLTPVGPGLEANIGGPTDLLPPAGQISVTSDGNVINSSGQILGIVGTSGSTATVTAEPSYKPGNIPAGTVLNATGLSSGIAKLVSQLFGTQPVVANTPGAPGASPFGKPLIANIPNQYTLAGGVLLFALMLRPGRKGR